MKQNKGITLITLIIYILLAMIALGLINTLVISFRKNLNNVNSKTAQEVEFDKLNVQLLKETKTEENFIDTGTATSTSITFENGNVYTFNETDKAVYLNDKIKIAGNISTCAFVIEDTDTEQILKLKTVLGDKTQITEYVMNKKESILPGKRATETTNYKGAIIPAGFTISNAKDEKTIENGLVIYLINDKTDEEIENITWTGEELENLKKTYDQFVWIPISHTQINKMFICQAKTGSNGNCNITVENGVAKCTVHNSKQMAGRLYAKSTGEKYKDSYTEVYTANSGLREPDIVTGNATGDGDNFDGNSKYLEFITAVTGDTTSYTNATKFKETLQEEYNEIVALIYNAGGYYVGRYETTNLSKVNETGVNIVSGTNVGIFKTSWYHMYGQQKAYARNKKISDVKSSMILGTCYDQMLEFVNVTGKYEVNKAGYVGHSSTNFTTKPYLTGGVGYNENYTEYETKPYKDFSKNIYDLEGNVSEWTTEANDVNGRVRRGRAL